MCVDSSIIAEQIRFARLRRHQMSVTKRHLGVGEVASSSDVLRALDSPTQRGKTEGHADQRDDDDRKQGLTERHPDGAATNFQ